MNFQQCPKCKSEYFIEVTTEWAEQKGIRIKEDGAINYDMAYLVEFLDATDRIIGYECQNCSTFVWLGEDGKIRLDETEEGGTDYEI